jgi:hypothetical protein
VATRGAGALCGCFGFALNTAATFDVFSRLEVTNDGRFYVVFESTPNGSEHIDVWIFWIRAQKVPPFVSWPPLLRRNSGESKLKAVCVQPDPMELKGSAT